MVEELLRNSLDKAYGKQGNPRSPGWANSHTAPLPRGLEAGRALCALPGPELPPAPVQTAVGLWEVGRCACLRGCWGCWSEGLLPLPHGPCAGGCSMHGVVLPADRAALQS